MIKDKIYIGEEIKEHIPKRAIENLIIAFKDLNLSYENDIKHCRMEVTPKGTCWITDTRSKTNFYKGKLIGTFKTDGAGFYFSKIERNIELAKKRKKIRSDFFKIPRKAGELYELDRLLSEI
ncbi:hypothetical protein [Gramella sp. MAR_2010_147]|uniref:hypothetical protein n=1 Tax=Gramella sp. MAR_2010_147 TaxID=1250205 RepID=UPI00087DAD1C|nr:hypothetical protein [Gramella sp. MAR_2010_147]SDS13550.1 hypothetical protein SAMN04488553_1555 [Gramella sp. MAR_2010_147]